MTDRTASSNDDARGDGVAYSGVLATYNDERHLAACLSRLSFCDDIVVVDLGSTDESVALSKEAGARVISHPWVPIGEMVRSLEFKLAKNDWLVMMDPDLLFPTHRVEEVSTLIAESGNGDVGLINFPLVTFLGDHPLQHGYKGGTRLYPGIVNRRRVKVVEGVHSGAVRLAEGWRSVVLRGEGKDAIWHYWADSLSEVITKDKRYLRLEGQSRQQSGQRFSWKSMAREVARALRRDLARRAYLDPLSLGVMLVQVWYTWQANLALRAYQRVSRKGRR